MAALHGPFAGYVGDTWEITGALFYADGTPFNLNPGCSLEWVVKDCSGNVALLLIIGSGIVIQNVAGLCAITVTPTQTRALVPGKYSDRMIATDPSGYVSTQWVGTIEARA